MGAVARTAGGEAMCVLDPSEWEVLQGPPVRPFSGRTTSKTILTRYHYGEVMGSGDPGTTAVFQRRKPKTKSTGLFCQCFVSFCACMGHTP